VRCRPKQDSLSTTSLGPAGIASSTCRLKDSLLIKECVGAAGAPDTWVTSECSANGRDAGWGGVTHSRSGGDGGVCGEGLDCKCAVGGVNRHGDSASGGSCGGEGSDGGFGAASTPAASV